MARTPVTRQQKVAAAITAFNEASDLLQKVNLTGLPRPLQNAVQDARAAAKRGRTSCVTALQVDEPSLPFPRSA